MDLSSMTNFVTIRYCAETGTPTNPRVFSGIRRYHSSLDIRYVEVLAPVDFRNRCLFLNEKFCTPCDHPVGVLGVREWVHLIHQKFPSFKVPELLKKHLLTDGSVPAAIKQLVKRGRDGAAKNS